MILGKKISLILPAINEAEGLPYLKEKISSSIDEVLIVDGGSFDRTREIAEGFGWKVIVEKRRGYGRAYKTGFEEAQGEIIATADADGTYPVEEIESLVQELSSADLGFISCSRFPLTDSQSMKRLNQIGNLMITSAASILWLHSFSDILSGMWVFNREVLKKFILESDNWNFSEEIKLRAYEALRERFKEVRISYHHRLGETKLMPWKVGWENILYMFGMRWARKELNPKMRNGITGSR